MLVSFLHIRDFQPRHSIVVGDCPVGCRIFNSILGLYPLNATAAPPVTTKLPLSADIAKRPLGSTTPLPH